MRQSTRAAVVLSLVAYASARAQQPDGASVSTSHRAAAQSETSRRGNEDDALLARAAKLYYSTKTAGLTGFDCTIHPDWLSLIQSAENDSSVSDHSENVMLLKGVAVTLHARMNGASALDWVQPLNASKPLDQASAEMLDRMHKAAEQTLMGFMQFWTPFVDGSVVPPNAGGMEITHSSSGITLHVKQPDTEVTEVFSNELILQKFKVVTDGKTIDLAPSYDSTDAGLLVSRFAARIGPENATAAQAQEMHVEIYYQTIGDFPIPSRLNMEVVGTGIFNFKLDGCRVNPTT
jgi:hypothetical protein